jgi:hypothetical protein
MKRGFAISSKRSSYTVCHPLRQVTRVAHTGHTHRLFLLSTSDHASHNEALSSRIAALNLLDLGLEHLDIGDANHAEPEVDAVVRAREQSVSGFTFWLHCLLTLYRSPGSVGSLRSPPRKGSCFGLFPCRWSACLSPCTRISADLV